MNFYKMHGLGNDFVIVEAAAWKAADAFQSMAELICDRHIGVGADGLVVVGREGEQDWFMRIFNPDGSEAEMCGNAIRCIARLAWEQRWISQPQMSVRTLGGIKYPEVLGVDTGSLRVRVDMGEPVLERAVIPMRGEGQAVNIGLQTAAGEFMITAVSMGNPHCVVRVEDMTNVPVHEWGPLLERNDMFPAKTNVEFIEVLSTRELRMRVWERGAGMTMACGTGACASLVAAVLNGYSERAASVMLDGGELFIEWMEADGHVYMTGPAELVFTGTWG